MLNTSNDITITDFVNTEIRDFTLENCRRAIPSIIDGLKRSQRKAVWAVSNIKGMETVERMALKSASMTAYKAGGNNMSGTIINLACDYPGSNNIPLIKKEGQFGSIIDHDSSSARYIEAEIHENYFKLFDENDLKISPAQFSKGAQIEPYYLYPKIPMVLINGGHGTGSGYASNFPCHNIHDVMKAMLEVMETGKVQTKLTPSYNGYVGHIIRKDDEQIETWGKIEKLNTTKLLITGLPPHFTKEKFKLNVLNPLLEDQTIKDYVDDSNETDGWHITITMSREMLASFDEIQLYEKFSLIHRLTPNYTLWDVNGIIKRFANPEEIVEEFVEWRLKTNIERRDYIVEELCKKMEYLEHYITFINDFLADKTPYLTSKKGIIERLVTLGVSEDFVKTPLYNLTVEKLDSLKSQLDELKVQCAETSKLTASDIMKKDIEYLQKEF